MDYDFYAYMGRMKYIRRWALMHSTVDENIMEHSWEVAEIAHALALIENAEFGGEVDPYNTLCYALYHEAKNLWKKFRKSSKKRMRDLFFPTNRA